MSRRSSTIRLTRIYTGTGDQGTTALGDGSRASKLSPFVIAYADVEETNAAIGLALSIGNLEEDVRQALTRIQNELFDVGADLCTPSEGDTNSRLRIDEGYVQRLETDCDHYNEPLPKLESFVLPGGSTGASLLHSARTIARRAERSVWALLTEQPSVNPLTAQYLNRLSDLLFILSRYANREGGDVLWQPGGDALAPKLDAATIRTATE